jgi:hypothetical protein
MTIAVRFFRTLLATAVVLSVPAFAVYSLVPDGAPPANGVERTAASISVTDGSAALLSANELRKSNGSGTETEEIVATDWTFTSKGNASGWSGQGQPTATTISGPSSGTYGTSVTFTATVKVTGANPTGTPTGTVNFYDGTNVIGSGNATGSGTTATAQFSTSSLSKGSHTIYAEYLGSQSTYIYSYSSGLSITIH